MKEFHLIAAVALNGVIGDSESNTMPWHIPLDLKHFRSVTMGQTVVMGSRTYQSIGHPLSGRRNVVITRSIDGAIKLLDNDGVDHCYTTFTHALKNEQRGFFVIGGQHIFGDALRAIPASMYITIVDSDVDGDVRFPIAGHMFKNNTIYTTQGQCYHCVNRSAWFEDGGHRIQFTKFIYVP